MVVITGASSGIGRATAEKLAKEGALLVLAARDEAALEEVARACQEGGGSVPVVIPTDVTNEEAVKSLAERAVTHYGRIDVWFNNAHPSLSKCEIDLSRRSPNFMADLR